jgi:hypothetical protein
MVVAKEIVEKLITSRVMRNCVRILPPGLMREFDFTGRNQIRRGMTRILIEREQNEGGGVFLLG